MSNTLVPHEVATKMMLAVGWNPQDFRIRDKISLAIAGECERCNAEMSGPNRHDVYLFNQDDQDAAQPEDDDE